MENIGKLLKKKRVDKGISLEDIAQETKIQLSILRCLEEGSDPDIGGSAYNRVMLLSYAKAIGCSEAEIDSLFKTKDNYNKVCDRNKESDLFPNRVMLNKNVLLGVLLLIVIIILALTIKSLYRRDDITFPRISTTQTPQQEQLLDNEENLIASETADETVQDTFPAAIEDRQAIVEISDVEADVDIDIEEPDILADETVSNQILSDISDNDSELSVRLLIIEDKRDYLSEHLGIDIKRIIPLKDETSYVRLFLVGD